MAEVKYKVQTYEIDFRCDVCGKGWYRSTGEVYPTSPAQYPHKCTVCGAEMVVAGHTYPYVCYEKIADEATTCTNDHMYKYGMRLRGYAPFCQPMIGLIKYEDDPTGRYHNILIYDRPLNDHEQNVFELDYLGEVSE